MMRVHGTYACLVVGCTRIASVRVEGIDMCRMCYEIYEKDRSVLKFNEYRGYGEAPDRIPKRAGGEGSPGGNETDD